MMRATRGSRPRRRSSRAAAAAAPAQAASDVASPTSQHQDGEVVQELPANFTAVTNVTSGTCRGCKNMLRNSKWGAVECNDCGRRYCRVMLRKKLLVCSQMRAAYHSTGQLCHCQLVDTGACPCQACFKRERRRAEKRKRETSAASTRKSTSASPRGRATTPRAKPAKAARRTRAPPTRAPPTPAAPARRTKRATRPTHKVSADSQHEDTGFQQAKHASKQHQPAASSVVRAAAARLARQARQAFAYRLDDMTAAAAVAAASCAAPSAVAAAPTRVQRILSCHDSTVGPRGCVSSDAGAASRAGVGYGMKTMPAAQPASYANYAVARRGSRGAAVAHAVAAGFPSSHAAALRAHQPEWRTVAPVSRAYARTAFEVNALALDTAGAPGDEDDKEDKEGVLLDRWIEELMTADLAAQGGCGFTPTPTQPRSAAACLAPASTPVTATVGGMGMAADLVVPCPHSTLAVDVYGTHTGAKSPPRHGSGAPAKPEASPTISGREPARGHTMPGMATHMPDAPAAAYATAWQGHFNTLPAPSAPPQVKRQPSSGSDASRAPRGGSPRSPPPQRAPTAVSTASDVLMGACGSNAAALDRLARVARSCSSDSFGPVRRCGRSLSTDSLDPLYSWS